TTWFNGGTTTQVGNASADNIGVSGGTLTGLGNIDVSSSFQWTGGTLATTGTITLEAGAQMTMASGDLYATAEHVDSTASGALVNWTSGTLIGGMNVSGSFNWNSGEIDSGTLNVS